MRKLQSGANGELGTRLRRAPRDQSLAHLFADYRDGKIGYLQKLSQRRTDRAGALGFDSYVGTARSDAARRMGLFISRPFNRLLRRNLCSRGALATQAHRPRMLHRSLANRNRSDGFRHRDTRGAAYRQTDGASRQSAALGGFAPTIRQYMTPPPQL